MPAESGPTRRKRSTCRGAYPRAFLVQPAIEFPFDPDSIDFLPYTIEVCDTTSAAW
jgi:hypothetical protein